MRMVEEKIVKINLRRQLTKVPRWRRKDSFIKLLKRKIKTNKIVIDKKLNERNWSRYNPKVRLRIIKRDDKSVKIELIE